MKHLFLKITVLLAVAAGIFSPHSVMAQSGTVSGTVIDETGWAYYAATQYLLGIRPTFTGLRVDPCIPGEWKEFSVVRKWRGSTYHIHVTNPSGVEKGVRSITADVVIFQFLGQIFL